MAKPWHIYLTESVKRSICKGFKIITTFTLTKIVIFFFLWSLIPKKFFCGGGVFVRMLTHACMYKVRKLSFCLGLLLIWCLCLSPPCFLRQSLSVKLGLTISFWPASPPPQDLPVFTTPGVGLQKHVTTARFYMPAGDPNSSSCLHSQHFIY